MPTLPSPTNPPPLPPTHSLVYLSVLYLYRYEALWRSFDSDSDANVTFIEFAARIIDHVAKTPAAAVPALPVEEQVAFINSHFNSELNAQCEALKLFFGL
jgi:hypothetical protein